MTEAVKFKLKKYNLISVLTSPTTATLRFWWFEFIKFRVDTIEQRAKRVDSTSLVPKSSFYD